MRHKDYFSEKGGYVLYLVLPKDTAIKVGSLGSLNFKKGLYAYVGRAKRNLLWRVLRHIRKNKAKRKRWHIDYLLEHAHVILVSLYDIAKTSECERSLLLREALGGEIIPGFGSSDCKCPSHLIYIGPDKINF